jgi:hypothetical protein
MMLNNLERDGERNLGERDSRGAQTGKTTTFRYVFSLLFYF